ncbi:DNA circularization N-terminal domain-containing protein [Vibrio sp. OPT18]|uniref:DNA circularization N-terminal domain-containing protein n=1 Tax=Vibrio sp. OPT18 TaxID=2778641 RepID=UPI00187FB16E|nr:DNA circularization N-terminal domain-containing protein [Vibrio sp. OPT18]MBE8578670.1 DNA circularization N-terminal domain-containing protein [Vibrio sp. OPT18]
MWQKKYEKGRWNGVELNILSTVIEGGKRLHVSEIAFEDLPVIKNMGSKAKRFSLEVVFVGSLSLDQANLLQALLDKEPSGVLEHPWLGELPLIFDTSSMRIDTRRGLVLLSLSFVRRPTTSVSYSITDTSVRTRTKSVLAQSSPFFEPEVVQMTPSQLKHFKERVTALVDCLSGIITTLSLPEPSLMDAAIQVRRLQTMIPGLSNEPLSFASQMQIAIDGVSYAVQSEPMTYQGSSSTQARTFYEAIDNARFAQSALLSLVETGSADVHTNIALVMGAINMNRNIELLEKSQSFDVLSANARARASVIRRDLNVLSTAVDGCINDVTMYSTAEHLALYEALASTQSGIDQQVEKVNRGSTPSEFVQCLKPMSALVIAHEANANEALLRELSTELHPLFFTGRVPVKVNP